jgi:drug/metabolite transporter (DMT)-like permease
MGFGYIWGDLEGYPVYLFPFPFPGSQESFDIDSITSDRGARDSRYPLGVAMVLTAGFCLSLGGVLLRTLETSDGWLVMFYRSIAFTITLLIFVCLCHKGRVIASFRAIGRAGLLVALLSGGGAICYIFSLLATTVANTMIVLSVTPLCTALLAWAVIDERVRMANWIAIVGAVAGVALMFAQGFTEARVVGSLFAFGAALGLAAMLVIIRRAKTVDMLPAICLGGVFSALTAAAMTNNSFVVSAHDLGLLILLGAVQIGGGFTLLTLGARLVPAAQVSMLALTEILLAPLWVWLAVDEIPTALTLTGGAVVLAAVVGQALAGLADERRGVT